MGVAGGGAAGAAVGVPVAAPSGPIPEAEESLAGVCGAVEGIHGRVRLGVGQSMAGDVDAPRLPYGDGLAVRDCQRCCGVPGARRAQVGRQH